MKKTILLLILSSIICSAQWSTAVQTTISSTNIHRVENFVNEDGIHVVTYDSNKNIKYYRLNSSGSVQDSATISTDGEFPNIVGDENGVYIAYIESLAVKIKYAANGSASFSNKTSQALVQASTSGRALDLKLSSDKLHVTWAEGQTSDIYYKEFRRVQNDWINQSPVYTGSTTMPGNGLSISKDANYLYVSYLRGTTDAKSWHLDLDTYSAITKTVTSGTQGVQSYSRIFAGTDSLFFALQDLYSLNNPLRLSKFDPDSSNWSSAVAVKNSLNTSPIFVELANENIYLIYSVGTSSGAGFYRMHDGNSWSSDISLDIGVEDQVTGKQQLHASTDHNDIYVFWRKDNSSYLYLKQLDNSPTSPTNLSINFTGTHPVLSWTGVNDIDLYGYRIYKKIDGETGWGIMATVTSGTTWTDTDVEKPGKFDPSYYIDYKVAAIDDGSNLSGFTNTVRVTGTTDDLWKTNHFLAEEELRFSLSPNYPNPFNPTTKIRYSIATDTPVKLKVYNVLGVEVATLVDNFQSAGSYTVDFSAGDLSSGVYYYKIQAGNFTDIKKMLFVK